jgi:hypothetical protein
MSVTNRHRALILAAGGIAGALLSAPAQSAVDTSPPTLKTPVKASFDVGEQIDVGWPQPCGSDPHDIRVHSVPVTFRWSGSDDSGSVSYSLEEETGANGPAEVFSDTTQTSYSAPVGSNGDQSCGGGNWSIYQWNMTASDSAGNSVTNQVYGGRIRLTQDNNLADNAATRPSRPFPTPALGGCRRASAGPTAGCTEQPQRAPRPLSPLRPSPATQR